MSRLGFKVCEGVLGIRAALSLDTEGLDKLSARVPQSVPLRNALSDKHQCIWLDYEPAAMLLQLLVVDPRQQVCTCNTVHCKIISRSENGTGKLWSTHEMD